MTGRPLRVLDTRFSIHRLDPGAAVPESVLRSGRFWIGGTGGELSIVCDSAIRIAGGEVSEGWSCIEVIGPLDFSLIGVLADLTTVLAGAEIGVFVCSTYDADFVLVPESDLEAAVGALKRAGYPFAG